MVEFLNRLLNPKNKITVLDLFNDPFVKTCIYKRKDTNLKRMESLYTNGNDKSPVKYLAEKFSNFSTDLPNNIKRTSTKSNNDQFM